MKFFKDSGICFNFCIFILLSFFLLNSAHALEQDPGQKKKVYIYDATPKKLKIELEIERSIIKDIVRGYIHNNKDLELNIVNDLKEILKELNLDKNNINEENALEIAELSLSDFFLSTSLSKEKGQYKLTLKLRDLKAKRNVYVQTVDFKSMKDDGDRAVLDASEEMFHGNRYKSNLYLTIKLCYLYPVRDLARIANNPGLGASLKFGIENVFINFLDLSIETGYFRFTYLNNSNDTFVQVPFFLCSGFRFPVLNRLGIAPFIGGGVSWIIVTHGEGKGVILKANSQSSSMEEIFKAGLEIDFSLSQSTSILLDANYSFIFEETNLDYININLGIKIKL